MSAKTSTGISYQKIGGLLSSEVAPVPDTSFQQTLQQYTTAVKAINEVLTSESWEWQRFHQSLANFSEWKTVVMGALPIHIGNGNLSDSHQVLLENRRRMAVSRIHQQLSRDTLEAKLSDYIDYCQQQFASTTTDGERLAKAQEVLLRNVVALKDVFSDSAIFAGAVERVQTMMEEEALALQRVPAAFQGFS